MLNNYKLAYIGFGLSTSQLTRNNKKNIIYVEKQGHTIIPMAPSLDYFHFFTNVVNFFHTYTFACCSCSCYCYSCIVTVSDLLCVGCVVSFQVAFKFFRFSDNDRCVHLVVSSRHVSRRWTVCLDCGQTLSSPTHNRTRPDCCSVRNDWFHHDNAVRRALRHLITCTISVSSVFHHID